jgi:peptidoglycan hydrolase CwlO-like protein
LSKLKNNLEIDMQIFEKLATDIVGGAVIVLLGWLGWKKANKVATSDGAEANVYGLMNEEIKRMAVQIKQLSSAYDDLSRQIITERLECAKNMAELKAQINELKSQIKPRTTKKAN